MAVFKIHALTTVHATCKVCPSHGLQLVEICNFLIISVLWTDTIPQKTEIIQHGSNSNTSQVTKPCLEEEAI